MKEAVVIEELSLQLLWVAPGTFQMGSTNQEDGHSLTERQQTAVTISRGFWLGRTEITQAQWLEIMDTSPSEFPGETNPVEGISWDDAVEFCRKLTERERAAGRLPAGYAYALPSEAQWEYACRAATTGPFAGGAIDDLAWYESNSDETTHPVATKRANPWGFFDMHGNVTEWCADGYVDHYPGGAVQDPVNEPAAAGGSVVTRGGSWRDDSKYCRSAARNFEASVDFSSNIGFRVALVPSETKP